MVQTQFYEKKNVKVFKSDNNKEYFNKVWGILSQKKGIIHSSSYNDTPQQNGVTKRKNNHFLEIA